MAPGVLVDDTTHETQRPRKSRNDEAPRSVFPDGIRTSGQHLLLRGVEGHIQSSPGRSPGRPCGRREDYVNNPERWVHVLTEDEVQELGDVSDAFIASGIPLTGISKSNFPLNKLAKVLGVLRDDLLNGKGFILFKRFPPRNGAR